eukprot:jgi/Psemu1/64210/estExt_Genemark1.C_560087
MITQASREAIDSSLASITPVLMRILLWVCFVPFALSFGVTPSQFNTNLRTSLAVAGTSSSIAPELSAGRKAYAVDVIDRVFGKEDSGTWDDRREAARATTLDKKDNNGDNNDHQSNDTDTDTDTDPSHQQHQHQQQHLANIPQHELVYGELGIEALATILDAVGVREGDVFLDIGSGDGLLVVGAALLYPDYLKAARGIEIVPELYQRSLEFRDKFSERLRDTAGHERKTTDELELPEVSFHLGNIYDTAKTSTSQNEVDSPSSSSLDFSEATLAICFATTWSKNIPGKKLDRLSRVLGRGGSSELPIGARVVIIDGVLEPYRDGYSYEGELRLHCPDTAPYSIARLYTRL